VDDDAFALRSVSKEVTATIERIRTWRGADDIEEIRRAARRKVAELCGSRPTVEVHLLRTED
jgi:hypothetical protein